MAYGHRARLSMAYAEPQTAKSAWYEIILDCNDLSVWYIAYYN